MLVFNGITILKRSDMKTLLALLTYFLLTIITPTPFLAQQDKRWENPFGIPGANGEVTAITRVHDTVIIGGKFTHVGAIPANGIALWDGKEWKPLGSRNNNGVNGSVYAIAVKGDEIYVGGSFTSAGGSTATNIAVWNRTTSRWSDMKGGMSGATFPFVAAIAVDNNNVYAGGLFTQAGGALASNIAVWNGNAWSRVGTGTNDAVLSIAIDADTLYAGGRFSTAGGVDAKKIAAWDIASQQWLSVGSGIVGDEVNTVIANDTALFVGGDFIAAGAMPAQNLAVWQRTTHNWDTITSIQGKIRTLALQNQDLLVGGDDIARIRNNKKILLDSSARMLKSVGGLPKINCIQIGANGEAIIGGLFQKIYSARYIPLIDSPFVVAQNFFILHQNSIELYSNGVNGVIYSIATGDNVIYVGGQFTHTGTQVSQNLAAWNLKNQHWQSNDASIKNVIKSITVIEDTLYASDYAVLWKWQKDVSVKNLTTQKGIYGGVLIKNDSTLYIANKSGVFAVQSDTQMQIIPNFDYESYIYSVLIDKQDIYVGGYFSLDTAGATIAKSLGRWNVDDRQWHSVGGFVDRTVHSIAMDSTGKIIIGGVLKTVGNTSVNNIAIWDPSTQEWLDMGGGANDTVFSVLAYQNNIYAAGTFSEIGGIPAHGVARWDGNRWHDLGLGVQGGKGAYALSISDSGYLYVGGDFSSAGGVPAWHLARWNTTLQSSSVATPAPAGQLLEVNAIYYTTAQQVVVSLATPLVGEATIELFTPIGQTIETRSCYASNNAYQLLFDVPELPAGYYFCRITGNGITITQRLIITP